MADEANEVGRESEAKRGWHRWRRVLSGALVGVVVGSLSALGLWALSPASSWWRFFGVCVALGSVVAALYSWSWVKWGSLWSPTHRRIMWLLPWVLGGWGLLGAALGAGLLVDHLSLWFWMVFSGVSGGIGLSVADYFFLHRWNSPFRLLRLGALRNALQMGLYGLLGGLFYGLLLGAIGHLVVGFLLPLQGGLVRLLAGWLLAGLVLGGLLASVFGLASGLYVKESPPKNEA